LSVVDDDLTDKEVAEYTMPFSADYEDRKSVHG
jgi:hypothetical protein